MQASDKPPAAGSATAAPGLNTQPQDFVVHEGQAFRVVRTSFDVTNSAGGRLTPTESAAEETQLKSVLDATQRKLQQQQEEMARQAQRIRELESFLEQHPHWNEADHPSGSNNTTKPSLAARRRAESIEKARLLGLEEQADDNNSVAASSSATTVASSLTVHTKHSSLADDSISVITPTEEGVTALNATFSAPAVMQKAPATTTSTTGTFNSNSNNSLRRSSSSATSELMKAESYSAEKSTGKSPQKSPPRGLAARLAMGSQERRRLAAQRREAQAQGASERLSMGGGSVTNTNATPASSEKKSGAGLRVSALEPLRARDTSVSSNTSPATSARTDEAETPPSGLDDTSPQSTLSKSYVQTPSPDAAASSPIPIWRWKDTRSSPKSTSTTPSSSGLYLFVAHDNPQIGNTVSTQLQTKEGMRLMIESKDDGPTSGGTTITCLLLATIVYSGPCEGVEGATSIKSQRGSQFLVCTDLCGYRADIKSYPTRTRGDIQEIDLSGVDPSCKIEFSGDDAKLKAFLRACTGRVDVILDPSHTGMWFPYWEGKRKMAPQFRSRGIGYLRLGDDMSRYGSAFLSTDAGQTFLDDGATSIVAGENGKDVKSATFPGSGGAASSSGSSSSGGAGAGERRAVMGLSPSLRQATGRAASAAGSDRIVPSAPTTGPGVRGKDGRVRPHSSIAVRGLNAQAGAPPAPASSIEDLGPDIQAIRSRDVDDVKELLTRLRDAAQGAGVKTGWSDRAEMLARIGQLASACEHSPALVTDIINGLTDTLTKQNNPHVLRAAIGCVKNVGECSSVHATLAWRALLLETIHLLRTPAKAVAEEARDVLSLLHISTKGRAISLSLLAPVLEGVLTGPRGRGSSSGSANTAKVVQWLATIARTELERWQRMVAAGVNLNLGASISSLGSAISSGGESVAAVATVDSALIVTRSKLLLSHREEATREAALLLVVNVIILDVLQSFSTGSGGIIGGGVGAAAFQSSMRSLLLKIKKADTPASVGGGAAQLPVASNVETIFMKAVSAQLATVLSEVSKASQRVGERILVSAVKGLQSAVQAVGEHAAKDSARAPAGGASAPSSPRPLPSSSAAASAATSAALARLDSVPAVPAATYQSNEEAEAPVAIPSPPASADKSSNIIRSSPTAASFVDESSSLQGLEKPRPFDASASTASTASTATSSTKSSTPRASPRTSPRSSPKDDPESMPPVDPQLLQSVSDKWYEAKLVLRIVPNTDSAWNQLARGTRDCQDFVTALTSGAAEIGIKRGALLRLVLPFDESTSSNDQAASGQSHTTSISALYPTSSGIGIRTNIGNNDTFYGNDVKDKSIGLVTGIGHEGLSKLGGARVEKLREQAVDLRRLIRVKMADEGDLLQAIAAMDLLRSFVRDVEGVASARRQSPATVVRGLE